MRSTALALLACAAVACAAAAAGTAPRAGAAGLGSRPQVIGFQEEGDPLARINESAPALSTVGVDGVNLTASGAAVTEPDSHARAQLARAHAEHLAAVLLMGNFDERIEDFNETIAYALLGSEQHIGAVAAQLAAAVTGGGWDGVSVDLESLLARDSAGLVAFVKALRRDLPSADSVNVDVSNYTRAAQYAATGYDLAALGASADEVTLMAYDQHGPWEPHPGPVGSLSWARAGLAVVLRSIPASKLDLGVAGYGYAWRPHEALQVSDAGARALLASDHAVAHYRAALGEWTARLSDGSTLWWSDARTFAQRLELAQAEHLHGLAVWSLGLSDPITR